MPQPRAYSPRLPRQARNRSRPSFQHSPKDLNKENAEFAEKDSHKVFFLSGLGELFVKVFLLSFLGDASVTEALHRPVVEIDDITGKIIGAAIRVHATLGPGLLESAYRVCLQKELLLEGLRVEVEVPIPVVYRDHRVDVGYRADLLVEDQVLVELKARAQMSAVFEAQLLSYLRLGGFPAGLLINFHVSLLRDGIRRMINQFPKRIERRDR